MQCNITWKQACSEAPIPHTLGHLPMRMQGGGVASGGMRELIPTVARTAVAAGVDGIFMEVRSASLCYRLCW